MKTFLKKILAASTAFGILYLPLPSAALTMPPTPEGALERVPNNGTKFVHPPMRHNPPLQKSKWFSFRPSPTPSASRGSQSRDLPASRKPGVPPPNRGVAASKPLPTATPFSAWNWRWPKNADSLYQDPPPVLPRGQKDLPSTPRFGPSIP